MKTHENGTDRVQYIDSGTISGLHASSVSLTVLGQLTSMKNSRRLLKNRRTGKIFSAKSSKAEKYADDFLMQVPGWAKLSLGSSVELLSATVRVFYPNWRSDLDTALVYDLLQAADVISNDRWIREHHEYAFIDAKNPRVEIEIRELILL